MASSNRHWPSMFKSKPCNPHHPWQHHDHIISTNSCHRTTPYTTNSSSSGCEERSPEPKPRWNPKPEQIRILEAIFNSGMVNPPRDEIRKIRAQLQEYGQVGDANVFYWFQNRKSRSKHKLRNLQSSNSKNHNHNSQPSSQPPPPPPSAIPQITTLPSSSSSSSSDKSPPPNKDLLMPTKPLMSIGFSSDVVPQDSPTASVNNNNHSYFHSDHDHPFFFPVHHNNNGTTTAMTQGFCFSELSNVVHAQPHHHDHQQNVGPCTSLLLSEMMNQHGVVKKAQEQEKGMKIMHHQHQHPHPHLSFCVTNHSSSTIHTTTTLVPSNNNITTTTVPSLITQAQGEGGGTAKSTVFINDVAFEVSVGPFNVREAFGDDAVLVHASGQPVLTNEWGITLHSLQHGAFYYLIWYVPNLCLCLCVRFLFNTLIKLNKILHLFIYIFIYIYIQTLFCNLHY